MLLRSIHLVGTVNNVLSDLPMADKMKTSGFTTVGEGKHSPLKCISCANSQCTTHSSEIPEKMSVPLTKKISLNRYSLALFGPITYAYAESLRRDKLIAMKNELLVDVDTVPCTPQSFIGFNMLTNMESHLRKQLSETAISKIEGLMALYLALADVQSATGFVAVLTLYAKTHNQTALTTQLKKIALDIFDTYKPQSKNDDSTVDESSTTKPSRPEWLSHMISGLTDWKLLINSPSFSQVSRVISLLITLGVIDSCSVNLGNFEIFAIQAQEKHANAIDLVDALLETVVYFAEGAYLCFEKGSLSPLLFSSSTVIEIQERCIEKLTEWEYVRNGNLEKYQNKSEKLFDKELDDLVEDLHNLYKTMPNGAEKKIIQMKWEKLALVKSDFVAMRVKGGLRRTPWCVSISGDSGVGKSTLADLALSTILKASGVPSSSEYVYTLNEKEKYMSSYRSFITGIKIDDFGNAKSQFWDCSPGDWIIRLCNNIREIAVMADLTSKGKMSIEPAGIAITSNIDHLHANAISNNPMSILRRPQCHTVARVKDPFKTDNMLDTDKVIAHFGSLNQINDIWLIDIKKPIGGGHQNQQHAGWEFIKQDIDIFEYLNYVADKATTHFKNQGTIVDSFKEPSTLINLCPGCNKLQQTCTCDFTPHYGERIAQVLQTKASEVNMSFKKSRCNLETKVEDLAVDSLLEGYRWFDESPYSKWSSWIPESMMDNNYVRSLVIWSGRDIIGQRVRTYWHNFALASVCGTFLMSRIDHGFIVPTAIFCFAQSLVVGSAVIEAKKNAYLDELVDNRACLNKTFISARDKHVNYACGAFAGLAVLYSAVKVVKALRASLSIQGTLSPVNVADLKNRDTTVNTWITGKPIHLSTPGAPVTLEHAENSFIKSSCQITIGTKCSGAYLLQSNVVLIPHHFLPGETAQATIHYGSRDIKFLLNPSHSPRVGTLDLAIVFVPNTGPLPPNLGKFCSEHAKQPLVCTMFGLNNNRTRFTTRVMWQFAGAVTNGYAYFNGSNYHLQDMNTFEGQCMSIIVRDGVRKPIVGFHIGGKAETPRGCGMAVLIPELKLALHELAKLNSTFILGPQARDISDTFGTKTIAISPDVHPKCSVNFLKDNAAVEVYGSVIGKSHHTSDVISTPISDIVEDVTGVPNQWGPPQFSPKVMCSDGVERSQNWKPWAATMQSAAYPSTGFDPADVLAAKQDYLFQLKEKFEAMSSFWKKDISPLSKTAIVSGEDGKKFVDSLKLSTSMGYGIPGKKEKYIIDLPPTETNACPRTFIPEIWEMTEQAEQALDAGESLNCIFGASLKDEPTKRSKDKVRVFQAAPIVLQILIRKYFLPIARFLSMNPLLSECAVGVNSQGPEWDELSKFMSAWGDERVIAGDYKQYDLRMPAQLTLAAFSTLIDIAQWSGNYSIQRIARMKILAHEVCTPLVAYNGTLLRYMGTNPSGHNMTVYINSIVNSLLHRLAWFDAYSSDERIQMGRDLSLGRPATLRDLCNVMTYGDDAKGSVHPDYDAFNHKQMAEFLERYDIQFTMPDKVSEPVQFMHRNEADFLKRKDRFEPALGVNMGMLEENSIFKSLHSITKSQAVTPNEVASTNISGALREWFAHGREVYEHRREQMKTISQLANLPVLDLELTFDDRVTMWQDKYGDLTTQSGIIEIFEVATHASDSEPSALTNPLVSPILPPEAASSEQILIDRVKEVLGKPKREEYVIISQEYGAGDLLYESENVLLVIECKRVLGRSGQYTKAKKQATKYASVFHILRPECCVYAIMYTEYGFRVVDVFGELMICSKFEEFLDHISVELI
jgi:hypothetical protein